MRAEEAFSDLATLNRWVPYNMVWNERREKFDKIPHSGARRLSTKSPKDWIGLGKAAEIAYKKNLSGVGFVMTGGVEEGDKLLVGLDFDAVDFDNFSLPFHTYAEISPSKTGVRAFAWVPRDWANDYMDTTNALVDFCNHAEIYLGSAPRFLTVTFEPFGDPEPIANLSGEDLDHLGKWLQSADKPAPVMRNLPDKLGTPVDLAQFLVNQDYKDLVAGAGTIDRSAVIHSMLITMVDARIPVEDILATVIDTPALWQFCLDHRSNKEEKAFRFAQEEVLRAYNRSKVGLIDAIVGVPQVDPDSVKSKIEQSKHSLDFPEELFTKAPGLVGEVARWIMDASFAPREEFAVCCALSLMSCMIGPYHTFGARAGKMNLYMTMVGETGTGKNEAMDTMCSLLAKTDARDCVIDFPASEAALRRQLNITPNLLLRVDELAHKLDSMQGQSNGASLGRAVLEAYNGARMPPKVYADERKSLPAVENPYVQILGGTTHKIWDVLNSSHLEDGTLNRFMFVCLPPDPPYRRNMEPEIDVPKDLIDKLNAFWRTSKRLDLIGGETSATMGQRIGISDEVKKAQEKLDMEIWEQQQGEFAGLYTRYLQNTIKIAAILAVSSGDKEIDMGHFEYASRFVGWCIENTYHYAHMRMADSKFERNVKRLLDKIIKAGGTLLVRDAYRMMHMPKREVEDMLGTMVLSGEIAIVKDEGNNNRDTIVLLTEGEPM